MTAASVDHCAQSLWHASDHVIDLLLWHAGPCPANCSLECSPRRWPFAVDGVLDDRPHVLDDIEIGAVRRPRCAHVLWMMFGEKGHDGCRPVVGCAVMQQSPVAAAEESVTVWEQDGAEDVAVAISVQSFAVQMQPCFARSRDSAAHAHC